MKEGRLTEASRPERHSLSGNQSSHTLDSRLGQSFARDCLGFSHLLRIAKGDFAGRDFVSLKWDLILDGSWEAESGVLSGVTHVANSSDSHDGLATFDVLARFSLRSPSLLRFPQLLITAYSSDFLGRPFVLGYGQAHLPFHEGKSSQTMALFSPQSSSGVVGFLGAVFGKNPEFVDPVKTIVRNQARKFTTAVPSGAVFLEFETVAHGLAQNGYSVRPQK